TSASDYVPNLSTLAEQKADLVIGVGFLMADQLAAVAKKYPQTHFALIDFPATALKGAPKNVEGLVFREQEAGYLAGYLAGLVQKQGSSVEFQVAGGWGLGVLDAAKAKSVWGIGVDADPSYLGPHVLTSAEKKVDVAVFVAIRQAMHGHYNGGHDLVFDVRNGGVGLGRISPKVPRTIVAQVRAVQ